LSFVWSRFGYHGGSGEEHIENLTQKHNPYPEMSVKRPLDCSWAVFFTSDN